MRHAAREPAEDPVPERADIDKGLAGIIGRLGSLVTRATPLLTRCPDAESAPLLRQNVMETVNLQRHVEELRSEAARLTAALEGDDTRYRKGWADCLKAAAEQAAKAAVPGPRQSRRASHRQPSAGQRALFSVPAIVAAAIVAVRTLGRAHRLAAALAAVTIPFAAGAGTYAALQPGVTSTASPPAASAPVPGWHTSATPVPSQSLAALTKPKHAARGKRLLASAVLPVPSSYVPASDPSSSSPPSSAAPVVSASVGPATLSVSAATLDLSLVPQATFTVTASGSGWASWRVSTSGTDLDFSQSSGVLQAGQSVTVTVSLASALDGLAQQSFTIAGQTIAVTLPLPVPVPSVVPSVVPSIVPSVLPSL